MSGPMNASTVSGPFSCRQREGSQYTPREGVTRRVYSGSGLVGRGWPRYAPPLPSLRQPLPDKSRKKPMLNPCPQREESNRLRRPRWRPGNSRPARSITREAFFGLRTFPARGAGRALVNGAASRVSALGFESLTHTLPSPAAAFPRSCVRDMFSPCAPTLSHPTPNVVVRIGCRRCTRKGSYRLARLAAKYGAEIPMMELLAHLAGDCAIWDTRHPGAPR